MNTDVIYRLRFKKGFGEVLKSEWNEDTGFSEAEEVSFYSTEHVSWKVEVDEFHFSFDKLDEKLQDIQRYFRNLSNEERDLFSIEWKHSVEIYLSQILVERKIKSFSKEFQVSEETEEFREEEVYLYKRGEQWRASFESPSVSAIIKENRKGRSIRGYTADMSEDEAREDVEFFSKILEGILS